MQHADGHPEEGEDLTSRTGCRGRAGASPRVLLNSTGAGAAEGRADPRRTPRCRKPRRDAPRLPQRPATSGGGGAGSLGGTGKERSRPLQVPSARRAASAPPGGKAAFPSPIVTLLSIRSLFLPRPEVPEGMGSEPWVKWDPSAVPAHRRFLNFQQMWKVIFACVCIAFT